MDGENEMMKDIVISHLFKSFDGKEVLKDFSAVLRHGEITSLMAPSGSGKTTLLRIIMGLETMDKGKTEGLDNLKISAVFQEDRLCMNLTPEGNIRLVNENVSKDEANEALKNVNLGDALDKKCSELSGGMKRRVAILRALMASYDLLLMDEPFRGLDDETKKIVIDDTLKRCRGKTVLMVTHDKDELKAMGIENCLYL